MARAVWSGTIAFGLVSVPVRMETAVEEHTLHFNYVHEQGSKTIDIQAFVPQEEIDPIYFERTYYLAAQESGEKVYALLARTMEESGLVAVATFVMREREHLACLRVRDRVITLERMHFADEIRSAKDLAPKGVRIAKEEREMAARLVEQYSGSFRPESFKDTYRETLRKLIRAKERGESVSVAEPEEPEEPIDLIAALRESVESAKGRRGRKRSRQRRRAA
jgi:DNA end-binding protein Ku